MKKIAMTGETGFLGKHLTNWFNSLSEYQTVSLGRNYLGSIDAIKNVDYLIHAASVHRDPDPENVYRLNMELHKELAGALMQNDTRVNIIFISSIQETQDNPYGRSKREGRELFRKYCEATGKTFISHSLPNLFGPGARPNHTSFVATFCYNLHRNIPCSYNSNTVNLCYVDDAVKSIAALQQDRSFFPTTPVVVKEVYEMLNSFKKQMEDGIMPATSSKLEAELLTTFLSYK